MVTGDAILTARAIAKMVSIVTNDRDDNEDQVMEGKTFMNRIGGDLIKICKHCEKPLEREKNIDLCSCSKKKKDKRSAKREKQAANYQKEVEKAKRKGEEAPDEPEDSDDETDGIKDIAEFTKIANSLDVLARTQPEHKYALVTGLK